MWRRKDLQLVAIGPVMVRHQTLSADVVLIEAESLRAQVERPDSLPRWQASELGHEDFDDKAASGFEMSSRIPEALDLLILSQEIRDRVVYEISDPELAVHSRRSHVSDRHVDLGGAGLLLQLLDHRG